MAAPDQGSRETPSSPAIKVAELIKKVCIEEKTDPQLHLPKKQIISISSKLALKRASMKVLMVQDSRKHKKKVYKSQKMLKPGVYRSLKGSGQGKGLQMKVHSKHPLKRGQPKFQICPEVGQNLDDMLSNLRNEIGLNEIDDYKTVEDLTRSE